MYSKSLCSMTTRKESRYEDIPLEPLRCEYPASLAKTSAAKLLFFQHIKYCNHGLVGWWEKPLVVALKHTEGIKHTVLLQKQAYKLQKLTILIHTLSFLSCVSLYSFPHIIPKFNSLFIQKLRGSR